MITTLNNLWHSYIEKFKIDINVIKDMEFVKQTGTSDDQAIPEGQGCKTEEEDEEERYFDAIEVYEIRCNKGQVVGQKSDESESQKSYTTLIPQHEELLIQQDNGWHTCFLIQPDNKLHTCFPIQPDNKLKAENKTGQFEKKAENKTGQFEKKAENKTGQFEKKAENKTGQFEKKAENKTGQFEKKAENKTGQFEKKAKNQTRQSDKKAEKQTGQVIHDSERREFGSNNKENAVEKHWRRRNYNAYCPCHSFKLLKRILRVFLVFLHCAWVDGLGDGRQEHKAVNGIFQHTLGTVSHCPNVSEYKERASDKCAGVCGTENCAYHCMRDSSKKILVEFCAKPVILFDYCPEYERHGKRIQKDIYTLCKPSKSLQSYYNSSDIFFCDPEKCRKLHDAGGSTDLTGLVTKNTQSNSRDINDTWSPQYWYMLLLPLLALFAVLVFACIFRKNLTAWFGKITKKRNSNGSKQKKESEAFIP